jgi:hypothetical protein
MSSLKKDGSSIISGDERTVERNSFRFWYGGGGDDGGDELVLLSWGDELVGVFVVGDESVLSSWGDESVIGVFVVGDKSVLLSWGDELVGEFVFGDELVLLSWGDESVGVFVVGDKLVMLSWGDESVLTPKCSFKSWRNCSASSRRGRGGLLPDFHWDAAAWSLLEVFAE